MLILNYRTVFMYSSKIEVKNEDESIQCDLCDKWNHNFCVDVSSAKYEKLKLSMLLRYCPTCEKEMAFSSLSNKEFNIFLYRNPPHHNAQATPLKKINKRTKNIPRKLKYLN